MFWTHAHYDRYESRWERNGGQYFDMHERWGGRVIYRDYYNPKINYMAGGPMVGDDRELLHGKWTTFYESKITYNYYWYGEDITEGEWALRNK